MVKSMSRAKCRAIRLKSNDTFDETYLDEYFRKHQISPDNPLYFLYVDFKHNPQKRRTFENERKANLLLWLKEKSLKEAEALDFGCGSGWASIEIAKLGVKDIVGIDIEKEYIYMAKARSRFEHKHVSFIVCDGLNLPLRSSLFDLVLALDVYEHIPDKEKQLKEFFKVLKPYGTLYLTTGNRFWPYDPHTFPVSLFGTHYLPKKLAMWYITKVRKCTVFPDYDKIILPTIKSLQKLLKKVGFKDLKFIYCLVTLKGYKKLFAFVLEKMRLIGWVTPYFYMVARK